MKPDGANLNGDKTGISVPRLLDALSEIRKAAGSCEQFTNRLQFIYERAGVALAGEEWSGEWKAEYGYNVRQRDMIENDELRSDINALGTECARLKAELETAIESRDHWYVSHDSCVTELKQVYAELEKERARFGQLRAAFDTASSDEEIRLRAEIEEARKERDGAREALQTVVAEHGKDLTKLAEAEATLRNSAVFIGRAAIASPTQKGEK